MPTLARLSLAFATALALLAVPRSSAGAQILVRERGWHEGTTGGELDDYLRALFVVKRGPTEAMFTLRPYAPESVERLGRHTDSLAHPWKGHLANWPQHRGLRVALLRPEIATGVNSAFPYGYNDGAVWAGRGVTTVVRAGAHARWGPLSVRLNPAWFHAQNLPYAIAHNGESGEQVNRASVDPKFVDAPQRFGHRSYQRLDGGQSHARIDLPHLSLGVSTENLWWGPARENALIIGTNAPGLPHAFVEARVPLYLAVVSARIIASRLSESALSPAPQERAGRVGSGIALALRPSWPRGLELSVSRFVHRPWPREGPSAAYVLQPLFRGAAATNAENVDPTAVPANQLAALGARWAIPNAGIEIYGELLRNDNSLNLRDAFVEPDHNSGYVMGLHRATVLKRGLLSLTAEVVNGRITHVSRTRQQTKPYSHYAGVFQGHTERGQLLGSPLLQSGGGTVLRADLYRPSGRTSIAYRRELLTNARTEGAAASNWGATQHVHVTMMRFFGAADVSFALGGALRHLTEQPMRREFSWVLQAGLRVPLAPAPR